MPAILANAPAGARILLFLVACAAVACIGIWLAGRMQLRRCAREQLRFERNLYAAVLKDLARSGDEGVPQERDALGLGRWLRKNDLPA